MKYSKFLTIFFAFVLAVLVLAQIVQLRATREKMNAIEMRQEVLDQVAKGGSEQPKVRSTLPAGIKIGVVDMNRIFTEYDKTKKTQAEYQVLEKTANRELEERIAVLKKEMTAIDALSEELKKPGLSKEVQEAKEREREEKITKAQELDRETVEFKSNKEKKFQDQFMAMRKTIIEEIMKVVDEQTKIRGFDLLLDKSGLSAGAVPVVLYAHPDFDISNEVIAILNKKTLTK